jgi:oxygen-independent coproporphyrinogen-3 oxidase
MEESGPRLYVHVPFCHSECTYCDFYRVSYREERAGKYLEALGVELAGLPADFRPPSIFVGGGTPSALREAQLSRLLDLLAPFVSPGVEYTFEVNPRSITAPKAAALEAAGVNRVSFGAQSFQDAALSLLGRRHRGEDVGRAFHMLRGFFANISFDLIFAWPGQEMEHWREDLAAAIELSPDHLSVYSLSYEPGTPLAKALESGAVDAAGEELERAMFLEAIERLTEAGYEHYEISNYARPGRRCRHNQGYWKREDYIGVGPAACSTSDGVRRTNLPDIDAYIEGLLAGGGAPARLERLSDKDRFNELVMLSLRTREGIAPDELLGCSPEAGARLEETLAALKAQAFLLEEGGRLRLSTQGLCVADRVIAALML